MNVEKFKSYFVLTIIFLCGSVLCAETVRDTVRKGNEHYSNGDYEQAMEKYDRAILKSPQAAQPKFNKANSSYRLENINEAVELYKQAAADSKETELVANTKYNLGNSFFTKGLKQQTQNQQESLKDIKTGISYWRQVLDINPKDADAARNIEVAKLIARQIKQQQQQQSPQDPNQLSQQQQQEQQQQQKDEQQQQNQQDQDQQEQQQDQGQQQEQKEAEPVDATAQQILEKEQRQKQERRLLQRSGWQKVEKDW